MVDAAHGYAAHKGTGDVTGRIEEYGRDATWSGRTGIGNRDAMLRHTMQQASRRSCQDKLGVETKQEMVVWAVRNGLLDDVARDG